MSFNKYAKYYEYFYENKKFLNEIKFVNSYLKKNNLKILDVGCGTGKFASYLSKNKKIKIIDAIDSSKEMLGVAKKYKNKKINFIEKNFLKFINQKNTYYDCVTLMFHVINYINLDSKLNDIFKILNKITKKDSIVILDTWTVNGLKKNHLEVIIKKSLYRNNFLRVTIPRLIKEKIIDIDFHFFEKTKKIFKENHKMKAIKKNELEKIAIKNNFKILGKFKNFTKEKFEKNDLFLTLVLKKY